MTHKNKLLCKQQISTVAQSRAKYKRSQGIIGEQHATLLGPTCCDRHSCMEPQQCWHLLALQLLRIV